MRLAIGLESDLAQTCPCSAAVLLLSRLNSPSPRHGPFVTPLHLPISLPQSLLPPASPCPLRMLPARQPPVAHGPAPHQPRMFLLVLIAPSLHPPTPALTPAPSLLPQFDIEIDGAHAGRIVFRLFDSVCPVTARNFRELATGENGYGYSNSYIHRVVPHVRTFPLSPLAARHSLTDPYPARS